MHITSKLLQMLFCDYYTDTKPKPENVLMIHENPAYDYVKTARIVTQKNSAYEDITNLH